ncbi:MAG: hypothetical protein AB7O43_19495 [Hyphomicrobiaceae bacterium]
MLVRVNATCDPLERDQLVRRAENRMHSVLRRFEGSVKAVYVHLEDVGSARRGMNAKRCLIEVRFARCDPEVTVQTGTTFDEAIRHASLRVRRRLENIAGELTGETEP